MGNKRNLHRMKHAHKKAIKAQSNQKRKFETKKRVQKLRAKNTAADGSDSEDEQDYKKIRVVRVIDEEKVIESLSNEEWEKVKVLPYVISIPESQAEFTSKIEEMSPGEVLLYLKRMREYNSFLADFSKKAQNETLFTWILQLWDKAVGELSTSNNEQGSKLIDALYKNIFEMGSALQKQFLKYIHNKLSAYQQLLSENPNANNKKSKVENGLVELNIHALDKSETHFLLKDIFYFLRLITKCLQNIKILHTAVLVVSNLLDNIQQNKRMNLEFSHVASLLAISGLVMEELANKETMQGKYSPLILDSVIKGMSFFDSNPVSESSTEQYELINLMLVAEPSSDHKASLLNHLSWMIKACQKFYARSEYQDYILPDINGFIEKHKSVIPKHVLPAPVSGETRKSILQLQKPQISGLKTFKPEKFEVDKEAKEEKLLKKEVKKAFRDARRELKKDSEAIQKVREEEIERRQRRTEIERKRVRRILEEESAEFKAMRSQEFQGGSKLPPKKKQKSRMAGNAMEK